MLILIAFDEIELDDAVEPLKSTLNHKVKQTAVKQEVEKNQELVRSALRCIAVLAKLSESGMYSLLFSFINAIFDLRFSIS